MRTAASISQILSPTPLPVSIGGAELFGGGEKEIRIGLGIFDEVPRHDRHDRRIDAESGRLTAAVSIRRSWRSHKRSSHQ